MNEMLLGSEIKLLKRWSASKSIISLLELEATFIHIKHILMDEVEIEVD
jgi:hypothetical protein